MSKIKNIIILVVIGAILVLIYIFLIKAPDETATLVSSSGVAPATTTTDSSVAKDFLTLLLNVKNIKLDDAIFSDSAFGALRDSSITLTPDGNEGRPNPFAPLGIDIVANVNAGVIIVEENETVTTP